MTASLDFGDRIIAIDPGPTASGLLVRVGDRIELAAVHPNPYILGWLGSQRSSSTLAIEMIASYGMPVGREVFETCVWIGRFQQAWPAPEDVFRVVRRVVKMHLCGSNKAKDPNIWQALVDRFGEPGTKQQPGLLYGVRSHSRAALALAVTVADLMATGEVDRLRAAA